MDTVASAIDTLLNHIVASRESIFRLALAAGLGGIVGLEREASGKPAGFRTNLLICVGSALLTDLSALVASRSGFGDPGRIAAQIVSGIGFLGAGTILQARGSVVGLTTAATLWVVAAIGMTVGAGAYVQALFGTVLVMTALRMLGRVEDHLLVRRVRDRTIRIVVDADPDHVGGLEKALIGAGIHVGAVDVTRETDSLVASFTTRGQGDYEPVLRMLLSREGVRQVTLT